MLKASKNRRCTTEVRLKLQCPRRRLPEMRANDRNGSGGDSGFDENERLFGGLRERELLSTGEN